MFRRAPSRFPAGTQLWLPAAQKYVRPPGRRAGRAGAHTGKLAPAAPPTTTASTRNLEPIWLHQVGQARAPVVGTQHLSHARPPRAARCRKRKRGARRRGSPVPSCRTSQAPCRQGQGGILFKLSCKQPPPRQAKGPSVFAHSHQRYARHSSSSFSSLSPRSLRSWPFFFFFPFFSFLAAAHWWPASFLSSSQLVQSFTIRSG